MSIGLILKQKFKITLKDSIILEYYGILIIIELFIKIVIITKFIIFINNIGLLLIKIIIIME